MEVTAAASLGNAVAVLGQQVGLATNGPDAPDLLRLTRKVTLAFQPREESRLFFFNDTETTEIYTLSLHDALPIWSGRAGERFELFTASPSSFPSSARGSCS